VEREEIIEINKKEVNMKKIFNFVVGTLIAGSTILLIANVQGAESDPGKELYNKNCQICHGIKGDGNGPAAASFSPSPADFTKKDFWKDNADQKITDAIENGVGDMPSFSDIKPEQIKEIIDYMSHTFKPGN
jgi:mono/diheme cytochrome c family protein